MYLSSFPQITYATLENGKLKLKKNDKYFYQIQGQMRIVGCQKCTFMVWTPLGFLTDTISYDPNFWKIEMEGKLTSFFYECLLPEILDSRKARGLPFRELKTYKSKEK